MDEETLARVFWDRVARTPTAPAQQFKRGSEWVTLSWAEEGEIVRDLALGLLALGRQKGDAVALLSGSRVEWSHADFAILSAGCVTVPVYPTYPPELIAYVINDSQARTLIVEDAVQLAKALEVRDKMPGLAEIVVIADDESVEPQRTVLTWKMLGQLGRDNCEAQRTTLGNRIGAGRPDDVATIVYTSGTTGPPKGVVQTHGNHLASLRSVTQAVPVEERWVHLLFLPLAHSFARLEGFLGPFRGLTTAYAESLDTVGENLKETRPHFICSVPRVFEKVYARILAGAEDAPALKRAIFHWAVSIGRQVSERQQQRQPLPLTLALRRRVADALVFSKLQHALGGRLQFAISGGAPLSKEIAEFFHAVGVLVAEGYGLTETCPALTFNRPSWFKFGSVGQALPGVELKIAGDGEILARGANIATRGYYKQPQATAAAFEADGWFHTGDIGHIDDDGFLFITDRKKDLIVTAGGMNIAPQNIENLLKSDTLISQAMVYGDRRPYPVALITLNPEELTKFAREHGVLATDPAVVVKDSAVVARVARTVEDRNAHLQSYARIKRFEILPADFTQENGELTPTLKLKRKVVAEKYRAAIENLYR